MPRACANCNSTLRQGKSFALKTSGGEITKCLFCALRHWPMLRRSLIVAAIMGTIISLLKSLSHRLVGELTNTGVGAMRLNRGWPVRLHRTLVGPQKGRLLS